MIEWILPICIGIIAGIITGLTPGIHINLVSTMILINLSILIRYFSVEQLVIIIISMGVIHSFLDFIPSIVFGIPSSDTAMSILPAHKLVKEGNGQEALFLSAIGSLLGAIFSLPLLVILFYLLPIIIPPITPLIPYGLLFIVLWFIIDEKKIKNMIWPILFISIASCYGILLLNSFHLRESLLILFTGLFGISSLIVSMLGSSGSIPKQNKLVKKLPRGSFKGVILGNCCAALCSTLPGLGNAQAASLLAIFLKNSSSKIFLLITSSLNTTSFLVSIITLFVLQKARNGAIVVVSQILEIITIQFLISLIFISIILAIIGFYLTMIIGNKSLVIFGKLNEKIMNFVLCLMLIIIIFFAEGFYGILCLLGISALGVLGLLLEVRRVHFMSILLIPVALFLF